MTGYQSKKAAARDKLAHMTFEQRCRVSEQCLPVAPYRAMLVALHDEMLEALAQPAQEPVCPECKVGVLYECVACSSSNYPPKPKQEPWPEEPFGHMAGGVQPPQRPWVDLTDAEVELYWDWEDFQIGAGRSTILEMVRDIEAKLKEKNNG